jgi:T5SS/PEP-CTERM-associated repeat protein
MTTYTWNAPLGGSFNTGTNWTPNGIPGSLDLAVFSIIGNDVVGGDGTPGAILVTGMVDFSGSIDAVGDVAGIDYALEIDNGGTAAFGPSSTATMEAGAVIVADAGIGLLSFESDVATISAATALQIATSGSADGTVLVGEDAAVDITGAVYVGGLGSGTLVVMNDGTLQVANAGSGAAVFDIGESAGAHGFVTIEFGSTVSIDEAVVVGVSADANGSVNLYSDSKLALQAGLTIGQYGTGAVVVNAGGTVSIKGSSPFVLGEYANAVGALTMAESTLSAQSQILVGDAGSGTFDITDGSTLTTNSGQLASVLGVLASASGSGTVENSSVWNNHQGLVVGQQGSGTLTVQTGGTLALGGQTLNIAEYAGSTGLLTLEGTLSSANAPLSVGPVATATTDATGGGSGTLELPLLGYVRVGAVTLAALVGGHGSLDISDGSTLAASGALRTGAGSSTITDTSGTINVHGATIGGGGAATATFTFGGDFDDTAGLTLAALGTLNLDVYSTLTAAGIVMDGGTLAATSIGFAATLTVSSVVGISGGNAAAPSALLGLDTTDLVLSAGVLFRSGDAVLLVNSGFDPGNRISNFHGSDTLDLRNEVYNTASYDVSTQQLVLTNVVDPLVLNVADDGYSADSFQAVSDGNGGTDVSLVPPCYLAGTRIATPDGERRVEELRPGDHVTLAGGGHAPLIWVGQRRLDPTIHPRAWEVLPIRIRRDALAAGLPRRDLLVSPDHALLLDGVLVEAKRLVNGRTIVQQAGLLSVHYWHLELARHDILLAEGVAAESYLDTGNRGAFADADAPLLHPGFAAPRAVASCAPFATDPDVVRPIWQRLDWRAVGLGHAADTLATTADPAMRLRINGRLIAPLHCEQGRMCFALPPGAREIRLVSRAAAPAWCRPWLDDRRTLGLDVARIRLRGQGAVTDLPLDGPHLAEGWWDLEPESNATHRWTNGDAAITLPFAADTLELTASALDAYPLSETNGRPAQKIATLAGGG